MCRRRGARYYGARALARLQELIEVTLHEGDAPLDAAGVIAMARGVDFIIADRSTPVPGEVFAGLPGLKVVMRSAIDIRNIDVAAASKAGVLVTHAEAGFVQLLIQLTLGLLVDLSRGVSRAVGRLPGRPHARDQGRPPARRQHGRHHRLRPHLARAGADARRAWRQGAGVRPVCPGRRPALRSSCRWKSFSPADYVVCLAIANQETENLMDVAAFARMKPDAFFVNMSRGNLATRRRSPKR